MFGLLVNLYQYQYKYMCNETVKDVSVYQN